MSNLRIIGNIDAPRKGRATVATKRAKRVGKSGGTVTASGLAVSGQRVRVTRAGVGEGWRIGATAAERKPHGAKNAHSDAASVRNAKGEPFLRLSTTNAANSIGIDVGRSSFDSERDATSGETSTRTAAVLAQYHETQLRRNIPSYTI